MQPLGVSPQTESVCLLQEKQWGSLRAGVWRGCSRAISSPLLPFVAAESIFTPYYLYILKYAKKIW